MIQSPPIKMINQELVDFVKSSLSSGKSESEVRNALSQNGWPAEMVEESMKAAKEGSNPLASSAPKPSQYTAQTQEVAHLPGTFKLLGEAFSIFKSRVGMFLAVSSIVLVVNFLFSVLLQLLGVTAFAAFGLWGGGLTVILLFVGVMFIQAFAYSALLHAAVYSSTITISEALGRGLKTIVPFFVITFLYTFVVIGGYGLLFIPGIVAGVWLLFSNIIFVADGVRGMEALAKSKEYVRHYWWPVFGRFFVFALLIVATMLPVALILSLIHEYLALAFNIAVQVVGPGIGAVFMLLIYKNLKAIKGDVTPASGTKGKLLAIGGLGSLISLALSAFILKGMYDMYQEGIRDELGVFENLKDVGADEEALRKLLEQNLRNIDF